MNLYKKLEKYNNPGKPKTGYRVGDKKNFMKQVQFSAVFSGGTFGFAEFKLRRNGLLYTIFVIRGSGTNSLDLEPGLYLISVNGVVPPGGAIITISEPTNPPTPDAFGEGPIFRSYVLSISI